jgi:hypothetical protein
MGTPALILMACCRAAKHLQRDFSSLGRDTAAAVAAAICSGAPRQ